MKNHLKTIALSLFLVALSASFSLAATLPLLPPQDDEVILTLSAEDWVTTTTARVVVGVEAAVSQKNAGSIRNDMLKSVNGIVKAKWRITKFNRRHDSSGLERWSAHFEARLPEAVVSGLNEQAKKNSKPGMQLRIQQIAFNPTLAEQQETKRGLRTKIYDMVKEQLADLNKSMSDRVYRVSTIDFTTSYGAVRSARLFDKSMPMRANAESVGGSTASLTKSDRMVLTANVVYAAKPTEITK